MSHLKILSQCRSLYWETKKKRGVVKKGKGKVGMRSLVGSKSHDSRGKKGRQIFTIDPIPE